MEHASNRNKNQKSYLISEIFSIPLRWLMAWRHLICWRCRCRWIQKGTNGLHLISAWACQTWDALDLSLISGFLSFVGCVALDPNNGRVLRACVSLSSKYVLTGRKRATTRRQHIGRGRSICLQIAINPFMNNCFDNFSLGALPTSILLARSRRDNNHCLDGKKAKRKERKKERSKSG